VLLTRPPKGTDRDVDRPHVYERAFAIYAARLGASTRRRPSRRALAAVAELSQQQSLRHRLHTHARLRLDPELACRQPDIC
jgi:hypothetical protein